MKVFIVVAVIIVTICLFCLMKAKAEGDRIYDEIAGRYKYRKDFHLDESWESIIAKFQGKRILTQEIVDAFVSEIKIYPDKNIEVKLYYDDMLDQLVSIADVREAECNGI